MRLHFEKITGIHLEMIFKWLSEPHVVAFWDNTPAHKDDILNFTQGRKTPSTYAGGQYVYWLAFLEQEPFALLMTIQETRTGAIAREKLERLSKTGHTYGLDYMIGNAQFLGKGYGARTLSEFIDYFRQHVDPKADTFLIDPDSNNLRAKHVYMNAGFNHVCDFVMEGDVSGTGKLHHLLVRKFEPTISIIKTTMDDYPLIQNMARFYVYDLSRNCGSISSDWAIPEDGLYESFDFKNYFMDASRKAYLVKVYDEIAGFALLNQATEVPTNTWNMGEFFIIAKFQGQGIAHQVVQEIWNLHPGKWEVAVIPENKSAATFWEKAIRAFTCGVYRKQLKKVAYDEHCPQRLIFEFDTQNCTNKNTVPKITVRRTQLTDIDAMCSLSRVKRLAYAKAQPQFWRYAGETGDSTQRQWFGELLGDKNYLMFIAESDTKEILGFIIGKMMPAPEVYNPGGLTVMIDDFCVQSENLWQSVGLKLIEAIQSPAKARGATQILVVCGAHDYPKRKFLNAQNLSIASEWFVGGLV